MIHLWHISIFDVGHGINKFDVIITFILKNIIDWKALIVFGILFLFHQKLPGQVDFVIVDKVHIYGNVKTSKNVIFKEIDLHSGDTIGLSQLAKRLASNEKRLQSIGLFTFVNINIKNWNTDLSTTDIDIEVQENWFIYPYVIFELADRNFNVWRKEHNYSFDRVNYGLALNHINFTGNKDKLKFKMQYGFTKKYEISYDFPYVKKKWGLSTNVLYSENREMAYRTVGNKLLFYKDANERKIFHQHRASISLLHRTSPLLFQSIRLEYNAAKIDTIISNQLNPDYFSSGKNVLKYFYLNYELIYDKTLYPLYPVGGFKIAFTGRKDGFGGSKGVNNTWFSISAERHTPIFKRLVLSNRIKVKLNLQKSNLPYYLNASLGYQNDEITGYQLYVLDGRDYYLFKSALKFNLLDKDFILGEFMPRQFKILNAKLFLRFNLDYGYSRDPLYNSGNPYVNRVEYGYGPAVDIILYNNFSFSCELGITRFGEKGLFYKSGLNF